MVQGLQCKYTNGMYNLLYQKIAIGLTATGDFLVGEFYTAPLRRIEIVLIMFIRAVSPW